MLLPTNGCWKPNYIPFPLCLWSNEQANHVQEVWQYVNRGALGSEHASQFSINQSIVAEFRRALCFLACVAWRFWLGALSNKGGRGQRNREEIGAGARPLVRPARQNRHATQASSILNVFTVHLNGIWHLLWRYLSKPVL